MPLWMRELGGLHQPRAVDVVVRPVLKMAFWLVQVNARVELAVLTLLSPMTVPVAAPVLLGIPARHEVTMTPHEAQALYGYDRPAEAHLDLRARQTARVLAEGEAPSDEGIFESQPILGSIA